MSKPNIKRFEIQNLNIVLIGVVISLEGWKVPMSTCIYLDVESLTHEVSRFVDSISLESIKPDEVKICILNQQPDKPTEQNGIPPHIISSSYGNIHIKRCNIYNQSQYGYIYLSPILETD